MVHLDLNLLTALDLLLEEGSVTGAAARLHLSAPAMSRTLARIRKVTGDEILVRTGRTMTPTPYALALRDEVHDLVQRAHAALQPEQHLDLRTLERTFTVRGNDAVLTAIGGALFGTLREQAPAAAIRLLAEASIDTNELRHGQVDLEIGASRPELPEISYEVVAQDRLVVAMRSGHPLAGRELTASEYADGEHIIVSRRGRLTDPMDGALQELGLRRRVVASAPTSTAALLFVSASDLVVAVPERMCGSVLESLGLRTSTLAMTASPVPLVMAWHQRHDNDRAHGWLRDQVRAAFADVYAPTTPAGTGSERPPTGSTDLPGQYG